MGLDGVSAWVQAPAGLASAQNWSVAADEQVLALGLQRQFLEGVLPLGSLGSLGLGAGYTSFGDLEARDASGLLTGSLHARRYAGALAWGWPLPLSALGGLDLGLSVTGYRQELGADAFSGSQIAGAGRWSWAPGSFLSFAGGTESLGLGAGLPLMSSLRIGAQVTLEKGGPVQPAAGLEWTAGPLALRSGWRGGLGESGSLGGLSAGLGCRWSSYRFDYAWLPMGALGDSHRLSLSYAPPVPARPQPQVETAPPPIPGAALAEAVPPPEVVAPPLPETVAPVAASATAGPALELEFRLPESASDQAILADEKGDAAALALYQEAIKKDPADTRAWMGLGHLYYRRHDEASALQCFEQVVRLNPTETALKEWVEKARARKKAPQP